MRLTPASLVIAILPVFFATACGGGGRPDADADDGAEIPPDGDVAEQSDATDDGAEDQPEAGCTADLDCDDSDPCTADACDEDFGTCSYAAVDQDGDGYAAASVGGADCGGTDCDDSEGGVHPGAAPGCDGVLDLDCDSLPDTDEDLDGHAPVACGGDDCDDSDPLAFAGSTDLDCGGSDRNCNGISDDDDDADGQASRACLGLDCDDSAPAVHWGATEDPCDGMDTNCNGTMDPEEDSDGDGFASEACAAPGLQVDCDDMDDEIHPGATEACDLVDSDCDGSWADAGADDDADGRLDDSCGGDDCDDSDPTAWIGAPEICDGTTDQDCDGSIDEPSPTVAELRVSTTAMGLPEHTSVAWSGSEMGIAWKDQFEANVDVWFARVSPDGSVVGSASRITSDPYYSGQASLAWSGSEYGVAFLDTRSAGNYEVYFARISATGAKVGSEARVTNDAGVSFWPSLAWGGSGWAVAWTDSRSGDADIWVCFLDQGGAKIGGDVQVTTDPSEQGMASLVRAGSGFGLAWEDSRNGNHEIYVGLIDGGGSPAGSEIRVTDDLLESAEPVAAWTGSGFGLTWRIDRNGCEGVGFAALGPDGALLGPAIDLAPSCGCAACVDPTIAWSGSGFGMAWSDYSADADGETVAAIVGPGGSPVSIHGRITTGGSVAGWNALAWTGTGYGAAWRDLRTGSHGIWATFFTACE